MKNLKFFLFTFLLLVAATAIFSQQPLNTKTTSLKTTIIDLGDEKYASTTFNDIMTQYKGKVIYLDFWASWCSPCRKEMPYSLQLQEKYAGKDVVFVYLSTDKSAQSWQDMIEQLQLTGMNYRASDAVKTEIYNKFNLQYIPRYVLIDKNGNVVDGNAKRPSNPDVVADIDNLL
jgi:thiol-disulfide isomerase/thioredoxin